MSKHLSVRTLVVASLLAVAAVAIVGKDVENFRIRDDCDPATFNAIFGDGVCLETFDGDTTVEEFLEELAEDKEVGSWKFNPDRTRIDRGQGTLLESRAGETHTFTRVAQFGGGFVPALNELAGFDELAPECVADPDAPILAPAAPGPANIFVPAGAKIQGPVAGGEHMTKGTTKWQCCIHPWMQSTVTVR